MRQDDSLLRAQRGAKRIGKGLRKLVTGKKSGPVRNSPSRRRRRAPTTSERQATYRERLRPTREAS